MHLHWYSSGRIISLSLLFGKGTIGAPAQRGCVVSAEEAGDEVMVPQSEAHTDDSTNVD